eukprot:CAMPEP_0197040096 /NCGR_PEP_ID=MMETSP1384-20130603/16838_1 /TAXON_ID=29189 /ORGANISM="Ammonia sp." /LENGTH=236 /DNA_ID=CAMNT_0042470789 /DNA_START=22 /DNA_END=732 /DNA_ORIENTATION=-
MTNPVDQKFESILAQKLRAAGLVQMLPVLKTAANKTPTQLLDDKIEDIEAVLNQQIVSKFLQILSEVQSQKNADDGQFVNDIAKDIAPQDQQSGHEMEATQFIDIPPMMSNEYLSVDLMDDEEGTADIADENAASADSKPVQAEQKEEKVEKELEPMAALKQLYEMDEAEKKSRQKTKVRLKVGSTVDIWSASKNQWVEGSIKEIRGDTLCVIYNNGRKMKWLKKNSKQLRARAEQ